MGPYRTAARSTGQHVVGACTWCHADIAFDTDAPSVTCAHCNAEVACAQARRLRARLDDEQRRQRLGDLLEAHVRRVHHVMVAMLRAALVPATIVGGAALIVAAALAVLLLGNVLVD
jgi:hypothetical protein